MERREFLGCAAVSGLAGSVSGESEQPAIASLYTMTDLDKAMQGLLASKRIGPPVFARITLLDAGATAGLTQQTARLATMVTRWFNTKRLRVFAIGGSKSASLSLTLQFTTGTTALLTVMAGRKQPRLDLMLLGHRGAVYHELLLDGKPLKEEPDPELLKLIRESLVQHRPMTENTP